MKAKTSIRFYNGKPVRARWIEEYSSWWYAAVDVVNAMVKTSNARRYWNDLKSRNSQLSEFCVQLKMTATDGKLYATDCLDADGVNELILALPTKNQAYFADFIKGKSDPIDEQSKKNAYELYENSILDFVEVGTVKGLKQIHAFLFGGLYDFAGKIRTKNISKGGFVFANCQFFDEIFEKIDSMPTNSIDSIIDKYIEMNIAHPFMEGNGRATRIWLDVLLKDSLGLCVDWQQIDKNDYLKAMEKSPYDSTLIRELITNALTDRIEDREIFMKGIDYSYYYETIDE